MISEEREDQVSIRNELVQTTREAWRSCEVEACDEGIERRHVNDHASRYIWMRRMKQMREDWK